MQALRALHERYSHLQEIIVQNFMPKPGTRMAHHAPPSIEEHLWTIAAARLLFGPSMSIQAPPNLAAGALERYVAAGLNDWGGVSPVTPHHVNPEAPWPHIAALEAATARAGKTLVQRLTIYPAFARNAAHWAAPAMHRLILRASDAEGFAREDDRRPGAAARVADQPAGGSNGAQRHHRPGEARPDTGGMFGHIEAPVHWARHFQTSWVKMGPLGAIAALQAGANDLGGTLMDESITRAAGAVHGQELPPERMEVIIRAAGRTPRQRTTLYGSADSERMTASFRAQPLAEKTNTRLPRKSTPARPDWAMS